MLCASAKGPHAARGEPRPARHAGNPRRRDDDARRGAEGQFAVREYGAVAAGEAPAWARICHAARSTGGGGGSNPMRPTRSAGRGRTGPNGRPPPAPGGRRRPTARAASLRPVIGLTGAGDRRRRKAPPTARAEARAASRRPHPRPSDPSRRPPAGSAPCARGSSAPGRAAVVRNPPSARFAGTVSPPWPRTMLRAMASPGPLPPVSRLRNASRRPEAHFTTREGIERHSLVYAYAWQAGEPLTRRRPNAGLGARRAHAATGCEALPWRSGRTARDAPWPGRCAGCGVRPAGARGRLRQRLAPVTTPAGGGGRMGASG